jgi:hypothetical protein
LKHEGVTDGWLLWQLGGAVFVATTCVGLPLSMWNSLWSLAVLCLVGLQYRRDIIAR